jgi:hypothetical protein
LREFHEHLDDPLEAGVPHELRKLRDHWHEALQAASLLTTFPLWPTETIDLPTMDRTYRVMLPWHRQTEAKRFSVTATLSWNWDALLSARFATTEVI